MAKKAVLIGINYPGTKAELRGCVNDVRRMHKCLVERYGFSEEDITILIDTDESSTQPTGKNIRRALADLVGSADSGDVLVVHYSGHGTRLPAETGEDDDTGYDECIVPCDMNLITGEFNQIDLYVCHVLISDPIDKKKYFDGKVRIFFKIVDLYLRLVSSSFQFRLFFWLDLRKKAEVRNLE